MIGARNAVELYAQSGIPVLQNRTYDSFDAARSCRRGDIRIVQDVDTGLIYNGSFDPELMKYDSAYNNEQAHSLAFQGHLDEVAAIIETHLGTKNLVEVGCGKAFFLELLHSRGFEITGFDPAYEGDSPNVQRRYFGDGVKFSADGIVLRHVLEHIPDPVRFLEGIRETNNGGLIYIEVPCLDWILNKRAWFDISYEHVNYFRLADFANMFGRVVDSGRLFGDQYLYVVADLATLRPPQSRGDNQVAFPDDFLASVNANKARAVWGAGSKGVIYALLRERSGNPVDVLIDINPRKQGEFVPATGLQVKSPEEGITLLAPGADVCVMNPNYADEIRDMTENRFNLIEV